MRAVIAPAFALLLAACVSPSDRKALARQIHEGADARVFRVGCDEAFLTYSDIFGFVYRALGMTTFNPHTLRIIRVDISDEASMVGDVAMARNVCAHELGHVLGLTHGPSPSAWMYETQSKDRPLIREPSESELREALSCPFDFVLDVGKDVPWEIRAALSWAVSAWNRALGRRAFTFSR